MLETDLLLNARSLVVEDVLHYISAYQIDTPISKALVAARGGLTSINVMVFCIEATIFYWNRP